MLEKQMKKIFYTQREDFVQSSLEREKIYTIPQEVSEECNIAYSQDGKKEHRLDIYRPKKAQNELLPVVINIHGGGLVMGNKEFSRYFCANLSKKGYLVFNVEYGLVPDCLFYDQCNDIFLAMKYIDGILEQYQGDRNRMYGVGDSGGAMLLTYCVAMGNNPVVAKAANVSAYTLPIKALGLISGMFYTTKFDKIGLFMAKSFYGTHYRKEAFAPYTNPNHKEVAGSLPPCLLVTSTNDHLRHYTIGFHHALEKNHVRHELLDFHDNEKLTHAFCVFDPSLEESKGVVDKISEFFQYRYKAK